MCFSRLSPVVCQRGLPTLEASADEVASAARKIRRARFCETCQGVKMDGGEHESRRGHTLRSLTEDEKDSLKAQVIAEARGGEAVRRDRIQRDMALQRERREIAGPIGLPDGGRALRCHGCSTALAILFGVFFSLNALVLVFRGVFVSNARVSLGRFLDHLSAEAIICKISGMSAAVQGKRNNFVRNRQVAQCGCIYGPPLCWHVDWAGPSSAQDGRKQGLVPPDYRKTNCLICRETLARGDGLIENGKNSSRLFSAGRQSERRHIVFCLPLWKKFVHGPKAVDPNRLAVGMLIRLYRHAAMRSRRNECRREPRIPWI